MKKMTAIICALAMLFSFATAVSASELDFMSAKYYSYDATMEVYFEQGEGMEFLSVLGEEAGVDVKYMVDELLGAKYTMNMKANMQKDFLAAALYVDLATNTPIAFSEDLKISIDSKLRMWMEYDVTSIENFKFKVAFVNPLNGKYMYVDLNDELVADVEEFKLVKTTIVETMKSFNMETGVKEIAELVKKIYEGKAKIEKTNDGYTVISFTNDSFVEAIFDVFAGMLETDYMKNTMALAGGELPEIDKASMEQVEAIVKGLGIFADEDAYTMKVKLDNKGFISEAEEQLHFKFNIYDIAIALGGDAEYSEPFTQENSNVDLKLISKVKYNSVNEDVKVEIPALTEENSVNLFSELYEEYTYTTEETYEYQSPEFWNAADGVIDNEIMYASVEYFIDEAYFDDDNLTGSVTVDENGNVVVVLSTDYMAPVKIEGAIGADTYKINGVKETGKAFIVKEVNDALSPDETKEAVFMNVDIYNKVLEAKLRSIDTRFMDYSGYVYEVPDVTFYFIRPNKGYTEE